MPFTLRDIPDQSGKLAVITGATGGLGYETAFALAGANATVVLTGRNAQKGADAIARIRAKYPGADISYDTLDLGSLASAADFARRFAATHDRLDILVNNAGIMMLPSREVTSDGYERQFETNYLGHFALTAHLLPLLTAGRARVVSLSSLMARRGRIHFDDLQLVSGYTPDRAYAQTKLACLMFALELQRRSAAAGLGIASFGVHPGISSTELIENGMGSNSLAARLKPMTGMFFQSPAAGALPTLYAATSPQAVPGGYYGPDGFMELRGAPADAGVPSRARDLADAARLWAISEQLAGVRFPAAARAA
jgi:NAD(P)-dependent dehydrogenase (short-subunit alcohol dehydrogenase family)